MPAFPMNYLRRIASYMGGVGVLGKRTFASGAKVKKVSNGGAASDAPKSYLITSFFEEAGEEIESAMDSMETVYFNGEDECAHVAVAEVLELYEGLSGKLPESERSTIERAMGLTIEQLKVELQQLDE